MKYDIYVKNMNIGFWYCNVNSGNQGWSIYSLYKTSLTMQEWSLGHVRLTIWEKKKKKTLRILLKDSWSTNSLLQKFRDLLLDCLLAALNQCED